MDVDDMVVMMNLLDTDGDGRVTKGEFGVYYRRLKDCSDDDFEAAWRQIDADGDGVLTLNELCKYYGIDTRECASRLAEHQALDDEKVLEALQLQSLLNEERMKQLKQQKAHADRLRALSELADDVSDDESSSPVSVTAPTMTMQDIIRESKRRGDIAARFFEE